jgi:hypothetical protein
MGAKGAPNHPGHYGPMGGIISQRQPGTHAMFVCRIVRVLSIGCIRKEAASMETGHFIHVGSFAAFGLL